MMIETKKIITALKKVNASINKTQSETLKNVCLKVLNNETIELVGTDGNSLTLARVQVDGIDEINKKADNKYLFDCLQALNFIKQIKDKYIKIIIDEDAKKITFNDCYNLPLSNCNYPKYEQLFNYPANSETTLTTLQLNNCNKKIGLSKAILKNLLAAMVSDTVVLELDPNNNLTALKVSEDNLEINAMTILIPKKLR